MSQEIMVNVTSREIRVALIEDSLVQEIHVERSIAQGLVGNIYQGRVSRLLPGLQAAFIDIGQSRSAFLHLSDLQNKHTSENIADYLKVGQSILVQVYKDALGTKGPRLTTHFTIASRYLVLTPNIMQIVVSQKIILESERARLLTLITPSQEGGYIFRTAAEGVTEDELKTDIAYLSKIWKEIEARATSAKLGNLVYKEVPLALRVIRDIAGFMVSRVQVDDEVLATQMQEFAKHYVPSLANKIQSYTGTTPLFDLYNVEEELQKALYRKIYLKSGGHIVFDQTEAMMTIDVNTGSNMGCVDASRVIFNTNVEAAEVIARQVRLRNLGGIIIIDFIDMQDVSHKTLLREMFLKLLAKDPVRTEISELSSLGLLQMTRKRVRESLEHVLCVPCPTCKQRGFVKSTLTTAYTIFREIQRISNHYSWPGFIIVASCDVINYIQNDEQSMLAELKVQTGKLITLQENLSFRYEQYDILPMSRIGV